MGSRGFSAAAALCVAASMGLVGSPAAHATDGVDAINGTFSATSNGEWATTNDRFQDETTVRSTWTVTSTCNNPIDCSGLATSSLGWTERIYTTNGMWYVKHLVPDWIPCPDGTRAPGLQVFRFYHVDEDGLQKRGTNELVGEDKTVGQSGACGRNQSLVMSMPFKLLKIS